MAHNYSNTASVATCAGAVNNSQTSITVNSFSGYPAAPYYILVDRDTPNAEVMEVTAVVGSTLTVVRGQGGTAAATHQLGSEVEHVIPAAVPQAAEAHHEASTNVHGVSGSLIGSATTGTLTSKTYQGAHVHIYSDAQPAAPTAGFLVTADTGAARDGFVAANTDGDEGRRGFLLTQSGSNRFEAFYDGTVRITPSGVATRPALDVVGEVEADSLDVSGNAAVGGTLGVTGNQTNSGTVTASGRINANASGTSLAVANNATVGGTLSATGAASFGGGVTVSSGNVVLSGSNAKLQFPSTSSGDGTATGQTRYRNSRLETWNGSRWLGTGITVSGGRETIDGTVSAINTQLYGYSVGDPGYRYRVVAQGQAEFNSASAGTRYDLVCVIDSITADYITSGLGVEGGSGLAQTGIGVTGELTGNHTVYFVARRVLGSGTATLTEFNQSFAFLVVPV